ncbi:glycosyltransferase family 2 protein [Propionivibrio sp.]|uniref:glycosyltransferase family 2 protein n=1 Tax=Propionivibrio sp. TaxID=2212460 RepID=UPI0025F27CBD|nr:glycosyltransferase family 2 protein [Propionivibrio sp.]MBK8400647.1 glycosyltransferase family 2 protein [Propionivibrio sp.]MBK8745452.1 glycosyltransferase family 2 protein [Propionivibrio sp.]MBK8895088.1 glycosyltransferase family 2 protein [Propionivibrio sp.]
MISPNLDIPEHPERPYLSVVVPAYNEEENVVPLAEEIIAALTTLPGGFELILVDDASTDATAHRIKQLKHPRVRAVYHRINCGQSAAVGSGFQAARGEWVATLDGDGQNDPADLPAMLEKAVHDRVDCVTGVRRKRQDNFIRRFSSRVANGFRNWITGDQVSDSGCGIRVVRRTALREIPVFNGMHRFLPTLLRGQGYTVAETTVNHRERLRGTSKYGVHNRLWRGIRDCFGIRWYLKRAVRSDRLDETRK